MQSVQAKLDFNSINKYTRVIYQFHFLPYIGRKIRAKKHQDDYAM